MRNPEHSGQLRMWAPLLRVTQLLRQSCQLTLLASHHPKRGSPSCAFEDSPFVRSFPH